MTRGARLVVFGASGLALAALLAWSFAGLPDFGVYAGRYGRIVAQIAEPDRAATNTVTFTAFDVRAVDTLVEEFIVFAAAIAAVALLRHQRGEPEREGRPDDILRPKTSPALRVIGAVLAGPTVVLALNVVAHGALTPGGGFQGGVVLAAAAVVVVAAGARVRLPPDEPPLLAEIVHGAGAAGFVLLGLGGLVFAGAFLDTTFAGHGTTGMLLSGGAIPLLNVATALEVAGAIVVILAEFLEQEMLASEAGESP
jgi:multicomponent Na+:H+ antiporter subunit B